MNEYSAATGPPTATLLRTTWRPLWDSWMVLTKLLGLWTNNVGSHPTFQRGASSSVIDVTFSSPGPYEVVDWEVLDDFSGSDHNYIAFNLIPYSRALNDNVPMGRGEHLGWASRNLDHAALSRKLDEGPPFLEEPASVEDAA
ncbi:hypothetical protein ACI65C_001803 [Semiaphis heraclei]